MSNAYHASALLMNDTALCSQILLEVWQKCGRAQGEVQLSIEKITALDKLCLAVSQALDAVEGVGLSSMNPTQHRRGGAFAKVSVSDMPTSQAKSELLKPARLIVRLSKIRRLGASERSHPAATIGCVVQVRRAPIARLIPG